MLEVLAVVEGLDPIVRCVMDLRVLNLLGILEDLVDAKGLDVGVLLLDVLDQVGPESIAPWCSIPC